MTFALFFLVAAFILALLATIGTNAGRYSLFAGSFACYLAYLLCAHITG